MARSRSAEFLNMKRSLLILLTMILSLNIHAGLLLSQAQNKQGTISRHFIIAIDVAYTDHGCISFISQQSTKDCIFRLLDKNDFCSKDYLSLVSYSLGLYNPDFSTFVTIANDPSNNPVKWRQFQNAKAANAALGNTWQWQDMTLKQHLRLFSNGCIGSMQSLAKQYILKTLKTDNPNQICNETILLMVTDEVVNGLDNNYVNEYNNVSCYNPSAFGNHQKEVFDFAKECDANFQFERTSIMNCSGLSLYNRTGTYTDNLIFNNKPNLKVVPYIVRPVVRPAIQAITDIPSPLPIKTVKGGYKLELNANVLSEKYKIHSLDLLLPNEKCNIDINDGNLFIERNKLSDGDSIALLMNVKYVDGIYNGISMTPKIPIYNQGLTLKTKFRLQQDTKILGIIPLHDFFWWFFPNDIQMEIAIWTVILILISILTIIFITFKWFIKKTRYVPNNKDISLVKI